MSQFDGKREVTGIICFFAAIALTLMYYIPDVTGKAGEVVRGLGFGLIGSAAFMIPLFLFYAAIDFFFEKRKGVAKLRVSAVIMLIILVASMFAICSMDFEYFKSLCVDTDGKAKATKAISLLWKSGIESTLIKNPSGDGILLTGGLLGGGIANALYTIAGRVIGIMSIIVFLLSQVILILNVSLKQTAKNITSKVSRRPKPVQYGYTNQPRVNPASTNATANPRQIQQAGYSPRAVPQQAGYSPRAVVQQQTVPATPASPTPNPRSQYIAKAVNPECRPVINDPFNRPKVPVDRNTGFIDVSDKAFGVTGASDQSTISFENRTVSTVAPENPNPAEFDYTSMPKNAPFHYPKAAPKTPTFLTKEEKPDFYDVGDGTEHLPYVQGLINDSDIQAPQNTTDYPIEEQYPTDLPEEIIDDYPMEENPYDYSSTMQEEITHPVRTPSVPAEPVVQPAAEERVVERVIESKPEEVPEVSEPDLRADIKINAAEEELEGFSRTEGRIIETAAAPVPVPEVPSTSEQSKPSRVFRKAVNYKPAPINLLAPDESKNNATGNSAELKSKAIKLEETLKSFGIEAHVINITHGPAITRFELSIATGVKVSRVMSLQDDIQLAMATVSIRIEAPIPGKSAIGIEIPNDKTSAVQLSGLIKTKEFRESTPLTVALGKDIPGKPIYCDLAKMPHLMIAGSTGSGKSVCINSILISLLCKSTPDDVRLIMIDPKVVELSVYNGIPHLIMPVVTDPKQAAGTLKWAVVEMNRRYQLFADNTVRDAKGYNNMAREYNANVERENAKRRAEGREELPKMEILPLILIVVDELADLMTVAAKEVEEHIARLAAMARAAGLHMIIATQRPSVDVITGVIKSNIPSRIAFAVSSGVDSRTILDSVGAEKLLGKGDMLYAPLGASKPIRGQGAFVSDAEVESIVKYFKNNYEPIYDEAIIASVNSNAGASSGSSASGGDNFANSDSGDDSLFESAVDVVIEQGRASVSILQRRLGIGYPRAGKLIDELEARGIIGGFEGSKPRKVLITKTDWLEMKAKGN